MNFRAEHTLEGWCREIICVGNRNILMPKDVEDIARAMEAIRNKLNALGVPHSVLKDKSFERKNVIHQLDRTFFGSEDRLLKANIIVGTVIGQAASLLMTLPSITSTNRVGKEERFSIERIA